MSARAHQLRQLGAAGLRQAGVRADRVRRPLDAARPGATDAERLDPRLFALHESLVDPEVRPRRG